MKSWVDSNNEYGEYCVATRPWATSGAIPQKPA
jgi:hypothetical protein